MWRRPSAPIELTEHAVQPTAPHDALPFEGQRTEGRLTVFDLRQLYLVITLGVGSENPAASG